MVDIIDINKDLIPYSFNILLDKTYKLGIKYNEYNDTVLVDLFDEEGNEVYLNETMTYSMPLWWYQLEDINGNRNVNFPDKYLIPLSVDGVERLVNFENLQDKIVLVVTDRNHEFGEFDFLRYDDEVTL